MYTIYSVYNFFELVVLVFSFLTIFTMAASDSVSVSSFQTGESSHQRMEREWRQANFIGVPGANVATSQRASVVTAQDVMHRRATDIIRKK